MLFSLHMRRGASGFGHFLLMYLCSCALVRASLYERPVNLDSAKAAHAEFRRVMREAGLKVLTVREILSFGVADHIGARVELEELAMRALTYNFAEGYREEDLREEVDNLLV